MIWSGAFFCLGRSTRFAELEFLVEYSFVRAPPSGGGSNAPRPAVSIPHIDVNADGCRARQARSCKNTACWGGISEILVASSCLQRLDDLQNWHHFQTVLDTDWNFAVAHSRALVSLLHFFTSSFGFLLGLFIAFVSARFASWKFNFLEWVHLKRDTNYRRYPTTSWHKLPTARCFVTK